MTSLEVLWNSNKEKVEKLWKKFKLPSPIHFNDITSDERLAIIATVSIWTDIEWMSLIEEATEIDYYAGRRLGEDMLSGIREFEESLMNDKVQEQSVRDISIPDREEG